MKRGECSRTALVVARAQALAGSDPATSDLVPREALEFALAALREAGDGRFARHVGNAGFRKMIKAWEFGMIPGLALHHALRKRAIERIVRRELRAGAERVVQIGAGFDALAYRLHREFSEVEFTEVDHAATQRMKRRVIASLGGTDPNLGWREADLTEGAWRLEGGGRTVLILEGVLMYLAPGQVEELFRMLRDRLGRGARLVFTFMDGPGFRRQSPLVDWWLHRAGEPMRWWSRAAALDALLDRCGLRSVAIRSISSIASGRARGRRVAQGEWICEAEFRERSAASQTGGGSGESCNRTPLVLA